MNSVFRIVLCCGLVGAFALSVRATAQEAPQPTAQEAPQPTCAHSVIFGTGKGPWVGPEAHATE